MVSTLGALYPLSTLSVKGTVAVLIDDRRTLKTKKKENIKQQQQQKLAQSRYFHF